MKEITWGETIFSKNYFFFLVFSSVCSCAFCVFGTVSISIFFPLLLLIEVLLDTGRGLLWYFVLFALPHIAYFFMCFLLTPLWMPLIYLFFLCCCPSSFCVCCDIYSGGVFLPAHSFSSYGALWHQCCQNEFTCGNGRPRGSDSLEGVKTWNASFGDNIRRAWLLRSKDRFVWRSLNCSYPLTGCLSFGQRFGWG